jgi:hypothetical protein
VLPKKKDSNNISKNIKQSTVDIMITYKLHFVPVLVCLADYGNINFGNSSQSIPLPKE